MKYYCIGIKGAGMSTLACFLKDLGNEVSGYDDNRHPKFTEEGLKERGIEVFYEAHPLDKDTIVTYSKAFSPEHPEIVRVRKLGLTIKEYNQVVGDLTAMYKTIGVSGTHGKTTITTMISDILMDTTGTNYYIGDGKAYANKDNKYLVIESDEFNKHFLAYHPTIALISNIEEDHLECYPGGIKEIREAFKNFGDKAEVVVCCHEDPNIRLISFNSKTFSYGYEGADVAASNVQYNSQGISFDVKIKDEDFGHFDLPFFGQHMLLNSLGSIAVGYLAGIGYQDIYDSLKRFKGATRRFEEYRVGSNIIIDDYAHHPSEIAATIKATRQKYPDRELVAIFMANTYSRTKDLFEEFTKCFKGADKIYITPITSDREKAEDYPDINAQMLVDKLDNAEMIELETIDKLKKHQDSVLLFMSCGSIYLYLEKYFELYGEKYD
jgi:UDP-N-acetylmuramate--alanine ligase